MCLLLLLSLAALATCSLAAKNHQSPSPAGGELDNGAGGTGKVAARDNSQDGNKNDKKDDKDASGTPKPEDPYSEDKDKDKDKDKDNKDREDPPPPPPDGEGDGWEGWEEDWEDWWEEDWGDWDWDWEEGAPPFPMLRAGHLSQR